MASYAKISKSKVSVCLVRQELNNRFFFLHLIGRKVVSSGYCANWVKSGSIVKMDVSGDGRLHIYDVEELIIR